MSQMLQSGDRIGEYAVERLLGKGSLSEVYLVKHGSSGEYFAMKVLQSYVPEDNPEYVKRFLREGSLAMKIRHPNLVAVHYVGYCEERGVYNLVMDYIGGSSLRTALAMGGRMKPCEAVRIVSAVADALAAGERYGLVHRDIKPENIIIGDDGSVMLVDLGVAKATGTDSLHTMSNTVFGTPNYISPEQAVDASKVDFRADVYSLGIVLFELLAGRRPYFGDSPADVIMFLFSGEPVPDIRTVVPGVSDPLARILARMCEKDPEKRISSASALIAEFRDAGLIDERTLIARPRTPRRVAPDVESFISTAGVSSAKSVGDALEFETEDTEISDFVSALKAKRLRRRICTAVAGAAAFLALCALALLVWRTHGS